MWSRRRRLSATAEAPPRDRDLVRLYWPVELRPAFDALLAVDDAMAEVVASATQPALAAIKLAWWREALGKLDHAPPPGEPRLQTAAAELLPRGVSGADLARLEDGWLTLVEERVDPERIGGRGKTFFQIAARLLGAEEALPPGAGRVWAEVDVARRSGRGMPDRVDALVSPKRLRPLTAMAALANRDILRGQPLEPEATPARAWTLLRHRLTGR